MMFGCEISIFMKNRLVDQSMETSKWKAVHAILEPIIDWSCVSLLYLIHHCEIIHDFDWVGCKLVISIFRALGCRPWKSRFVSDPTRQHKTWTVWISHNDCVRIEYNLNREGYVLALHWYSGFYPVFAILTASMKHDILAKMTALSCDPSPLHVTIHS